MAAAHISQRLLPVQRHRVALYKGRVDLREVRGDCQGHAPHKVGDDAHGIHVERQIAVDGLVIQQHGDGELGVLAAVFAAVAVVVGQCDLLVRIGGYPTHNIQNGDFCNGVTVDLEHLPGLVGVIHYQHDLDICLTAALIAVHGHGLALFVDAHQQVSFQLRALLPGLAVIGNFLQLVGSCDDFAANFIRAGGVLPVFPEVEGQTAADQQAHQHHQHHHGLHGIFFVKTLFLTVFHSVTR